MQPTDRVAGDQLVEGDRIRGTLAITVAGIVTRRWTDDKGVTRVAFVDAGRGERVVEAAQLSVELVKRGDR